LKDDAPSPGILFLVATPIGNLEDVSLRALRVLGEVGMIAAEDTRHTRKLLSNHGIKTRLISYREQNHSRATGQILAELEAGHDVALVSDAGTPALSDPGQALVAAILDKGFRVVPVPGPVAAITALTASGLPSDRFLFKGFLPRKQSALRKLAAELATEPGTLVFYESPRRIAKTLLLLAAEWGPRDAVVVRELTKVHETFHRGTLVELAEEFSEGCRGEVTLVISGATELKPSFSPDWQELVEVLRSGARPAAGKLAGLVGRLSGLGRNEAYRLLQGRGHVTGGGESNDEEP